MMTDPDTSAAWLDQPGILNVVFHPRPDYGDTDAGEDYRELMIPVDDDVVVCGRFYAGDKNQPAILFFHGNGEIVADYNEIARCYTRLGASFIPVGYRGYGKSTGQPTTTAMREDAHKIYAYIRNLLVADEHVGPFVVMGRSLGSASAIELASSYPDHITGLIVESGFAQGLALLLRLGADLQMDDLPQTPILDHTAKIRAFTRPTLIIHGVYDQVIPFSDAEVLYAASGSEAKQLVKIDGADHNNLLLVGFETYMQAVTLFLRELPSGS